MILFGQVLFTAGITSIFGVKNPVSLNPADLYRPLFWGGLWAIPFGFFIKATWKHLYLFGLLSAGGPIFTVYLLLVNVPFGIITALAARAIIGKKP